MKLPLFQIDAFANKVFEGNPAAVCPLESWLPDTLMQSIAESNNLSETAFFIQNGDRFDIRWFTPLAEVDLCGHATLAAAHVIYNHLNYVDTILLFDSKSGTLRVHKEQNMLSLDFPALIPKPCDCPTALVEALGKEPLQCLKAMDYIAVFKNTAEVIALNPNDTWLSKLDKRGLIVTSTSDTFDFVARFFAPKYGIKEDPVTGSAYTQLVPFWAKELHKTSFHAKQVSKRGGELFCSYSQDRVKIGGNTVEYLRGEIYL